MREENPADGVDGGGVWTRAFPARLTELPAICRWTRERCAGAGMAEEPALDLELCVHELVANLVLHGGATARLAPVRVSLTFDGGSARVRIEDSGRPFDPLLEPERPAPASFEELTLGGYGIPIVRHLARDLRHRREADLNILEFTVGPSSAGPGRPVA